MVFTVTKNLTLPSMGYTHQYRRNTSMTNATITININGEDINVPDKETTANELIVLAGLDSADHYLMHIDVKTQVSYASKGGQNVPLQMGAKFVSVPVEQSAVGNTLESGKPALNSNAVEHEKPASKDQIWKLNVQGVLLKLSNPLIVVRDALIEAGFDPNTGWIAVLKRTGEGKVQVSLADTIDLTLPGIEKLRLTPAEINNGEVQSALRRDFALLPKDETFLKKRGLTWETIIDVKRRWLILRGFVLPSGFNHSATDVAIEVPPTYPTAEIDMFHCLPHLTLVGGSPIAQTEGKTPIQGQEFQQWSRHLNGTTRWDPKTDSVMTHIAVIEAALSAEVGE
jgi:hypothetical protein